MPDYDISHRGNTYRTRRDITLPAGITLLSYDNGIVNAQLSSNGMRFVVLPFGKGSSAMVRRLCVGGSRLEDAKWAGACHVIEHADFRTLPWLQYGGMDKNAATSKTFIEHQAYLLLDPHVGHVQKELQFQLDTMLGKNLVGLSARDIKLEIDNVLDERDFNSQAGAAYRKLIMKCEELLLPRVWGPHAWVKPTIGNDHSLSNIRDAQDLLQLHHMFRSPDRTHLVMSGPVDINRSLQLFADVFSAVPRGDASVLREIPPSLPPCNSGRLAANVTTNSGTRNLAIAGTKSAYGPDGDVAMIMQHLVGVLGSQPAAKQHGIQDVTMYYNPEEQAGVYVILAKVTESGDEEAAMAEAQHAIEEHILAPLRTFEDQGTLSTLLGQYRASVYDALQSGPQTLAAMAVKGILACDKPSLLWHVADRFSDRAITPSQVRAVANRMFDASQLAVVRCTQSPDSVGLARSDAVRGSSLPMSAFHAEPVTSHLAPDCLRIAPARYMRPQDSTTSNIIMLRDARKNHVATAAYNTNKVYPLCKKSVACHFGKLQDYGGWAQTVLAAEALNAIAKVAAGGRCKFEVSGGALQGEVTHSTNEVARPGAGGGVLFTQPLVSCVAMATAVAGAVPDVNGLRELRRQLPMAALKEAVIKVSKAYESPSAVAQCQTRSQMCSALDPGYQPADVRTAVRMLQAEHKYITSILGKLSGTIPHLAGTNTSHSDLARTVQALGQIAREAKRLSSGLQARNIQAQLQSSRPPDIAMVQTMPGLRTYPYVASASAKAPLRRADRAQFIVASQIMAGGMGSVYTHDLRQRGVSYRPSGGARLGWQPNPVIILHATFDAAQAREGSRLTVDTLRKWCNGDRSIFTPETIQLAKANLREQLQLTRMDYDAQKYSLFADMDPDRYSANEVEAALHGVSADSLVRAMRRYFGPSEIKESWVALDDSVLI